MTRMEDLTDGRRVRHPNWGQEGTVRVTGGETFVRWDGSEVDSPVTEDGYLTPAFLEITGEGP